MEKLIDSTVHSGQQMRAYFVNYPSSLFKENTVDYTWHEIAIMIACAAA